MNLIRGDLAGLTACTHFESNLLFTKVLTTTATSHFSSRIFMKLGFKEVMITSYEDYKIDGEVVFKTSEPHTHARKYVRKK